MKKIEMFLILFMASLSVHLIFAQTESGMLGPQPLDFKISTDQPTYHYAHYQGEHEKMRILVEIPQIIPNEKVIIKSVYSRGPHTFTDSYPICSETILIHCFTKLDGDIYYTESNRQYGTLFGQWALDAKYAGKRATTVFEITTLNPFEIYTSNQKYTLQDLKESGFDIVFLGSQISNQTTLKLEIFKMNETKQTLVFQRHIDVEITAEPPYFNRLPVTFTNKVPFIVGKYNITASWGDLFDSDIFEIVELVSVTDKPQETNNGCLIATAAFGTELAPEIQRLREFRDSRILSTISGKSFLQIFNSWYYSFSPTIADMERQYPILQIVVKNSLYPLIGILEISKIGMIVDGEIGIIMTGFIASILIGSTYMWPVSLRLDLSRFYKQIIAVIIFSVGWILSGIFFSNIIILMAFTTIFVIASVVFGITLSTRILSFVRMKNKKWSN